MKKNEPELSPKYMEIVSLNPTRTRPEKPTRFQLCLELLCNSLRGPLTTTFGDPGIEYAQTKHLRASIYNLEKK